VLLDFYASWCPACVTGAPDLLALHDAHAAAGLMVIGVTEEPVPTAMQFAAQQGFDGKIPVAVDERRVLGRQFGVSQFPTQVLVDRRGLVRWRGAGATRAELDAQIRTLLAAGP
jgi:thiol-disulfide isomerase/thioredoxin